MSNIDITTGTEGPHHDPYGYTEITVTRESGVAVTLHQGLCDWIKVDDHTVDCPDDIALQYFERFAGITAAIAERVYEKRTWSCSKCGGRDLRAQAGYPGETFYFCTKCDIVVNCDFNEAAII